MNNKQIMYDCDKGYILSEKGPVGATCVGGLWRPIDMPKCLPGLHPRLRWTRRKREMNSQHKHKLLRNFSRFKHEMNQILRQNSLVDDPFPVRPKRSLIHQRGQRKIHRRPIRNHNTHHKWHLVAPAIMRFKRNTHRKRYPDIEYEFARPLRNDFQQEQRNSFEEEQQRAYNKYYERIRQRHRNYINNLLRASHRQSVADDEPFESTYQNAENYKTPSQDPFDEINAYASMPIPLPNINENRNVYTKELHDGIVNNTFVGRSSTANGNGRHHWPQEPSNDFVEFQPKQHEKNVTNILDLLRSQIIRRRKRISGMNHHNKDAFRKLVSKAEEKFHRVKRSAQKSDVSLTSLPQHDEETRDGDAENAKKSRPKEPCEVGRLSAVTHNQILFKH